MILQTAAQQRPDAARLAPREQATEMRARADDATNAVTRAYWLWLAEEWDKTVDRERTRPLLRSWAEE